jgi:hypothetical protein
MLMLKVWLYISTLVLHNVQNLSYKQGHWKYLPIQEPIKANENTFSPDIKIELIKKSPEVLHR